MVLSYQISIIILYSYLYLSLLKYWISGYRIFVYSFDVIHTLGIYSWGVKIDAIPGRINVATTLRLLTLPCFISINPYSYLNLYLSILINNKFYPLSSINFSVKFINHDYSC